MPPAEKDYAGQFHADILECAHVDPAPPADSAPIPKELVFAYEPTRLRVPSDPAASPRFRADLLGLLQAFNVPGFQGCQAADLRFKKDSVALTNSILFLSCATSDAKAILRIYGPATETFLSRETELRTLHALAEHPELGLPKIYGTFKNGRLEEYFDCQNISLAGTKEPAKARLIARRLAQLHRSPAFDKVQGQQQQQSGLPPRTEAVLRKYPQLIWQMVLRWMPILSSAIKALRNSPAHQQTMAALDWQVVLSEVAEYYALVRRWYDAERAGDTVSDLVFAHNDVHSGNILLKIPADASPDQDLGLDQLILIDYEFAGLNPRGFDLANHFFEWRNDYSKPDLPWDFYPAPTTEQKANFYHAYLGAEDEAAAKQLEEEIKIWYPASPLLWTLWAIIQATNQISNPDKDASQSDEDCDCENDYDYLKFAIGRLDIFRIHCADLGMKVTGH